MTAIHCADCGTGCVVLYGREVDPSERDIADARVWACPACACSWARHDPETDAVVGAPAGPETRHARAVLIERRILPLVLEGAAGNVGAQPLVIDRLTNFLARRMGIAPEACEVARFDLERCRAAWSALRGVAFAEVRQWARESRGPKRAAAGAGVSA